VRRVLRRLHLCAHHRRAGVGAASVISPVYISEVVPARARPPSSVQQVMIITA
jgi:hypothetical protein